MTNTELFLSALEATLGARETLRKAQRKHESMGDAHSYGEPTFENDPIVHLARTDLAEVYPRLERAFDIWFRERLAIAMGGNATESAVPVPGTVPGSI